MNQFREQLRALSTGATSCQRSSGPRQYLATPSWPLPCALCSSLKLPPSTTVSGSSFWGALNDRKGSLYINSSHHLLLSKQLAYIKFVTAFFEHPVYTKLTIKDLFCVSNLDAPTEYRSFHITETVVIDSQKPLLEPVVDGGNLRDEQRAHDSGQLGVAKYCLGNELLSQHPPHHQ
ncbi:hypothetical protein J6590_096143 [Homalodisca vitripennis]|nr:hypothetical protein J6590_096143 [Homalodisca vitripennis]